MMRIDDRVDDVPPYSRLFVVCSKSLSLKDLQPLFEKYGTIEKIHMPKDRATGDSKGIAYVKYTKTSSAAAAIEGLHLTNVEGSPKPLKVMIASYKSDDINTTDVRYTRLFIKIPRDATKEEITEHFSKFGDVVGVYLQRDKSTSECKGFAYVNFNSFLGAAKALEECHRNYKPIFATPKDELKRTRNKLDTNESCHSSNNNIWKEEIHKNDNFIPPGKACQTYNTVNVVTTPIVLQKYLEKLFNVVPGMIQFKYSTDPYNGICKATVKYNNEKAAVHAFESLNNFEFPSGEMVFVKPETNPFTKVANNLTDMVNSLKHSNASPDLVQLADAIEQASSLIKAATTSRDMSINPYDKSNVDLPPPQPLAPRDSKLAQRCFIVCKPAPPPLPVLQDIFCRFGDLIDVMTFPRKTYGFARYASVKAAQHAMATLDHATVCGVTLKVLEATEKEDDFELKRPKID